MRLKSAVIGCMMCMSAHAFELNYTPLALNAAPANSAPSSGSPAATASQTSAPAEAAVVESRPIVSHSTPVIAQPVTSQPVTSQPVTSQPVTSQPVTSQPVASQPVTSQPVTTQPVTTQPVKSQPIASKLAPAVSKLPKSGVAVPGAFITRPSMAMVSPLGIQVNSSPAGFGVAPTNKKSNVTKSKNPAPASQQTPASNNAPVSQSGATANPAVVTPSSTITSEGQPEAGKATESETIEEKKPDTFNPSDYVEKPSEWTYASRYKDGRIRKDTYCPLVAVSLGYGSSSNLGASNYFSPAVSGGTNFYNFMDHTSSQSQTVYGFFAGYELVLDPVLSMQAGLSYYQSGSFTASGLVSQGASPATAVTYPYHYNVSSQRWLIESKFLYNRHKLHPYIMAGLGAALNKSGGFGVDSGGATTYQFGNSTTGSVTYSVGVGLDFDLASDVRIGFGYRFSDYGRYKLSRGVIGSLVTTNDIGQAHLYVNEFLAQFMLFF